MIATTLGVLIALTWVVGLLRVRRYRAVFRIPASRNDQFVCRGPQHSYAVPVDADGVELPASALAATASAFLAIDVSATALGHVLDPSIEVRLDAVSYRQYFERGAAGARYLNLSPALQQAHTTMPRRIALRGNHIRWTKQGSLTVFDPPAMGEGDTLIVAPHPDDSEIAAFGLYSQRRSWIVTVTAGERSQTDLSSVVPPEREQTRWRALLRVWDSLTIPQLGGVPREHCLNLVFPDTRLKQMHDSPTRAFRLDCEDSLLRQALRSRNPLPGLQNGAADCTWGDLVGEIRWLLDTATPRIVVCPHPLVDPSPDHVFTSLALAEALRNGSHQPDLFLLYVVHVNEAPIYPFGGADSVVSLPPWEHAEWVADSIYSHALSENTRRGKFFAVEAAHDLRVYPDLRPRTIGQLWTLLRRELTAFAGGLGLHPTDFRRRAPRPNELYYMVSAQGFRELAQRAQRAQKPSKIT